MSPNLQRLNLYLAAEQRILRGQSVRLDGRERRMADLEIVRDEIQRLTRICNVENRSGSARFATADFGGRT
ncbi:hypothetical protein WCE55_02250 [Luteimonas sp. MJ293]|uniref:hypothetical protein n=1 Tax=Luteimonas sp. MJ146 TaxID=3129240 RepID=UPI0031BB01DF